MINIHLPPDDTLADVRTFQIRTPDEAENFENFLNQYYRSPSVGEVNGIVPENYIKTLYLYCHEHRKNGRLFYAVIDLELTYLFMMKDCFAAGGVLNQLLTKDKFPVESILENFQNFSGKMEVLYRLNSFAFRCRAFWDKYMGVLILLYEREKYDEYSKAKSRKKSFRTIASKWDNFSPHIQKGLARIALSLGQPLGLKDDMTKHLENNGIPFPEPFLEIMLKIIDALDCIRTAEAHGTGTLRKWSLSMLPIGESRDTGLYNHWNHANEFMHALRETIQNLNDVNSSHQSA